MSIRNTLPSLWRQGSTWNPIREMNRMQRQMDRMFDEIMPEEYETSGFTPACDIDETDAHYLVSFDLPGVKKENVKVELRENQLTVSGERKEEHKVESANRLSEERYSGSFMRTFTLPTGVKTDQVEASFENGVLRVVIAKAEGAKSKQIPILEKSKLIGSKAA